MQMEPVCVHVCVCVHTHAAAGRILLRKSRTRCHLLWPQHQKNMHTGTHTHAYTHIKACAAYSFQHCCGV